jgi:hypothetical protein
MSDKIVSPVRRFIATSRVLNVRAQREDGRRLLSEFVEQFLSDTEPISFLGFQSGFQTHPDLILFRAEEQGSTLSLPASILLEPREIAVEIVRRKIADSRRAFGPLVQR